MENLGWVLGAAIVVSALVTLAIQLFLKPKSRVAPIAVETPLPRETGVGRQEPASADLSIGGKEHLEAQSRAYETELRDQVEARARMLMVDAMERLNSNPPLDSLTTFVPVESEDMKGRIIGREGKNIRAFEHVTGVDLLVDEQPGGVVLSSFDARKREIARIMLLELMRDKRIQPARIESVFASASQEVDQASAEAAKSALKSLGIKSVPPRLLEAIGQMRFRSSYGQNLLEHSIEVAHIAGTFASELHFDRQLAVTGGFLHDIGKVLGPEYTEPHALAGMRFLRELGFEGAILNIVGAHHYELDPESPEAKLVIVADTLSATRPGARSESLESHLKRLESLEDAAKSFPGVADVHIVQSGREVRVLVRPEEVSESQSHELAEQLASRLEAEMPAGTSVKLTIIRETRTVRSVSSGTRLG